MSPLDLIAEGDLVTFDGHEYRVTSVTFDEEAGIWHYELKPA